MLKRKSFAVVTTLILTLCLVFSAAIPATVSADDISDMVQISDARIYSPPDGETYKVGDEVPIRIYAGFIVYGAANWIQVSIEKDGKQVYWNCYNYMETTTEYDLGTFRPTTSGTYTIKAGTTNSACDSSPNSGNIRKITSTRKFKVKASTIKTIKPELYVERTAKTKAVLTWETPTGAKTQIYAATSKNGKYKKIKTTSKSKYTVKKLSPKKVYYYKIRFTKKEKGKTVFSKYSAIEKAAKYKPAPPFEVTLKSTAKGVKISWGKFKDAGFYLVDKATSSSGEGDVIDCLGGDETVTYDSDVKSGKTYYYRVTAWVGDEQKPRAKTKVVKIKYKK